MFKRFYATIYDSGGNPYTKDNPNNVAILVYAKRLDTVVVRDYPYDWWEDDLHGEGTVISALVTGTVAGATMTHVSSGLWYIELDSDVLDVENPERDDQYIIKIGLSTDTYIGWDDANWEQVQGYDPTEFRTLPMQANEVLALTGAINEDGELIATSDIYSYTKEIAVTTPTTEITITDDLIRAALAFTKYEYVDKTFMVQIWQHDDALDPVMKREKYENAVEPVITEQILSGHSVLDEITFTVATDKTYKIEISNIRAINVLDTAGEPAS